MSSLAATTASRAGASRVTVANRTRGHADRLAAAVGGDTADLAELPGAIADADLVISCTGASGLVITADLVRQALTRRDPTQRNQARWSSSTWPCPGTSAPTWPSCPA